MFPREPFRRGLGFVPPVPLPVPKCSALPFPGPALCSHLGRTSILLHCLSAGGLAF